MPRVKPGEEKRKALDWPGLKLEFMRGPYKTLKEFAQAKNLVISTLYNGAAGWVKEKETFREIVAERAAIECTLDEDIRTATEMNIVHVKLWDKFLSMVQEAFADESSLRTQDGSIKLAQLERLASVMERAQKGQRLALNMDRETRDAKNLLGEISEAIAAAKAEHEAQP